MRAVSAGGPQPDGSGGRLIIWWALASRRWLVSPEARSSLAVPIGDRRAASGAQVRKVTRSMLPSHERPTDTGEASFSNLKFPLSWEKIFEHIGWPAYMKPHAGGGWKSVYKLRDQDDFFKSYSETGQLVMMLQEEIIFDDYFRCYCLGRKHVRIMQYEPRNPHHLRYQSGKGPASDKLLKKVHGYVLDLCNALGYDFNTVEMAVRDGVPYAIDFCNPAPDADVNSVGQENFDWVVQTSAKIAVERAREQKPGSDNLTWGTFVTNAVAANTKNGSAPDKEIIKKEAKPKSPKKPSPPAKG